jgi:hypothetical protein
VEVFLLEMDIQGPEEELMKVFKFEDNEVMAVKLEHWSQFKENILKAHPDYVPKGKA